MIETSALLNGIVSTPDMDHAMSGTSLIQAMLRFEAALSGALEDCGLAPLGSEAVVTALLADTFLTPERAEAIRLAARAAGNLAIPFVKLVTEAVSKHDPGAAGVVHQGATSQDVLDSALCLQMKDAFELLAADLDRLRSICAAFATQHAETVMVGRTWLQQGPPVTLGLKVAGWVAALDRQRERLRDVKRRCLRLQFGGAVGTLASLGSDGIAVSKALSRRLELPESALPWHTQRDNLVEIASTLGNLIGTLGKMARDISLLMQSEVGEVLEPIGEGRGGSSTMPHKRNPVGSAAVLAAATCAPGLVATMFAAMPQEHERGLGGWQAEWETLPQLFRLTAGALGNMNDMAAGLEVHADVMVANLDRSRGLVLAEAVSAALSPKLGRSSAHSLVESASQAALREWVKPPRCTSVQT